MRSAIIVLLGISVCVAIETISPRERSSSGRSLGVVFNLIDVAASVWIAAGLATAYRWIGIRSPLPPVEQWAGILALPVVLLLTDFLKYWEHRFEHRFMWSVHKVHHSPTNLHAANSFAHPLQFVPMFFIITLPLSLLNFKTLAIPTAASMFVILMAFFIHSPTTVHLGPLWRVLVDNRYHRIHHSVEQHHLERNYSIFFPFWDVLFRTAYRPKENEWPDVGISEPPPQNITELLMMPFPTGTPERTTSRY
jgi:sterol desaturase/sphingolipid hydroxylase (fatty acid hydroxylase superfamily)